MKIFALATAFLLSVTAVAAAPSPAAPTASIKVQCLRREALVQDMVRDGASPVMVAPTSEGALMEIWSNDVNWITVLTAPDGISCPVARGIGPLGFEEPRCIDPVKCPRV